MPIDSDLRITIIKSIIKKQVIAALFAYSLLVVLETRAYVNKGPISIK